MRKLVPIIAVAVTLTGCARFYASQEAAFQERLPQLVADCNEVFRGSDRPASWEDGVKACKQLSDKRSLGLVEPRTMEAYAAYQATRTDTQPVDLVPFPGFATGIMVPYPLPQVQ